MTHSFGGDGCCWRDKLKTAMIRTLIAVVAFFGIAGASLAQGLPDRFQSVVLLNIIAEKGAECGLLNRWEEEIVRSIAEQDTLDWDDERKAWVAAETQSQLADTSCEAGIVPVWIDSARPGIRSEYLSLYLVVYRTFLEMDDPPTMFEDLAQRDRAAGDIDAIDAALADMQASGAKPDGGGPWPEFIEKTSAAVREFAPILDAGSAPDDVAFLVPHAITIGELWLAEYNSR